MSSTRMIQNLTNDLLDMAKITKGVFTLNYNETNLVSLIIEAFTALQFKVE